MLSHVTQDPVTLCETNPDSFLAKVYCYKLLEKLQISQYLQFLVAHFISLQYANHLHFYMFMNSLGVNCNSYKFKEYPTNSFKACFI